MGRLIRFAETTDSEAILNIYSHYILYTAVSFEITVPSIGEFANRIEAVSKQYPYLVYIVDGRIIGYAYAARHRERAAYCYDVDLSVYVLSEYHGTGIAYKLYGCLFEILKKQGFYNAYAAYALPNEKSMLFHRRFGFTEVGTFRKAGYKFGKWHDLTWVEKAINSHETEPSEIKTVNELPKEYLDGVLRKYSEI